MKKKLREKALIPLPPTGFTLIHFAKSPAVKTLLLAWLPLGLEGGMAVSQSEKICKNLRRTTKFCDRRKPIAPKWGA